VKLLTRAERMSDDILRALVVELGGDAEGRNREQLVEQVVALLHEQILHDELLDPGGLDDDPPAGPPTPFPNPTGRFSPMWAARASRTCRTRRRRVIGRISRLLWRSLKDASGGRARIWRAAITVTERLGAAVVRVALRKFVKVK
jgi:hypothetical protein